MYMQKSTVTSNVTVLKGRPIAFLPLLLNKGSRVVSICVEFLK